MDRVVDEPKWPIRLSWIVNPALLLLLGMIAVLAVRLATYAADEVARTAAEARKETMTGLVGRAEIGVILANFRPGMSDPDRRLLTPFLVDTQPALPSDRRTVTDSAFPRECWVSYGSPTDPDDRPVRVCSLVPSKRDLSQLLLGIATCDAQLAPRLRGGAASSVRSSDHLVLRISSETGLSRHWLVALEASDTDDADAGISLAAYPWQQAQVPRMLQPDARLTGIVADKGAVAMSCPDALTPRLFTLAVDLRCLRFEEEKSGLGDTEGWATLRRCQQERTARGWRTEDGKTVRFPLPPDLYQEDQAFTQWLLGLSIGIEQIDSQYGTGVARTTEGPLIPGSSAPDRLGKAVFPSIRDTLTKALRPGEAFTMRLSSSPSSGLSLSGPAERSVDSTSRMDRWLLSLAGFSIVASDYRQGWSATIPRPDPAERRSANDGHFDGEFFPAPVEISTAIKSRLASQLMQHWHLIAGFMLSIAGIFLIVNLTLLRPLRILARAVHDLGDEAELSDPEEIPYIRSRTEVGEVSRAFVSVLEEVRLKAKTLSSKFFEQQEHRRQANVILEQERQLWPVIAHEIRSPVHTLMRDLEKEGTEDAVVRIRFLRRVETAMDVVEKLRSGEQIEAPSAAIDLNKYCLDWAANADDRFQPISVERAGFPVWVRVAVELIDMILENLASNAIRHRYPDDSPLVLRVDAKDGHAILHFINSGDPIPGDRVPFLFDLHYSDGPRRTKQNRGIGLFISRHYARLMGGSLTYRPAPDVATFELLIPLDIASLGEDAGESFASV